MTTLAGLQEISTGAPVLVDVPGASGEPLQGLLYPTPSVDSARAAVLHVHGKGGNFYSGPPRTLPPLMAPERYVHLALNLRCHDLAYSRLGDRPGIVTGGDAAGGGMWERLADGPVDIAAGVRWLRERTGLPVHVIAHSAGGYFLGDWAPAPDTVASRILLSPLTSVRFPLATWFGAESALRQVTAQAESMVQAGRGHLLIPVPTWYFAISADSLLERLRERPDRWLEGCNASGSPLLLVWGGAETRAAEWREMFQRMTVPDREMLELPGAGHEYAGVQPELAAALTAFLDART